MNKLKGMVKSIIGSDTVIYKIISKVYHKLSTAKYKITHIAQESRQRKYYAEQVKKAVNIINEKYKEAEYIVFYNPTWLGVANSTKGLFKDIVPLEQVFGDKNIRLISEAVLDAKIKKVIFSQIVDGWTDVLRYIKDKNQELQIKVIWHANNYEVLSDYTWELNKNVLKLYDKGYIDEFAFVKKSMAEFYNRAGYKAKYIPNNVNTEGINKKPTKKTDLNNIRVGLYNANTRELKNAYTQLNAIRLLNNAKADIVPTNEAMLKFVDLIGLENDNLPDYITTKELLERCQDNDINIYITFTECSPMLPLESFEVGVPCLVGNNNDYFQNSKLGEYVIVDREDDAEYIANKIIECLKNKEEVMGLYKEWKKEYDAKCKEYVSNFVK